ncbi:unannotated protein [freshwater metagenome]|uniref:Unannotated protein n=1 Tax=freshwater metagenome TaxID=449393 RepID=A0A6J5YFK6_9ZZZZ
MDTTTDGSRDRSMCRSIRWSARRGFTLLVTALAVVITVLVLPSMVGASPSASASSSSNETAPVVAESMIQFGPASVGGNVSSGSPEAVVIRGTSGIVASWWGGSGPRWTCGYYMIDTPFVPSTPASRAPFGVDPVEGVPYALNCDDEAGHPVMSRLVIYTPGDPFGGVAVVERAVAEARRRIELTPPVPRTNPASVQLVGLATWLWVENPWFEQSATASIGDVSATVHAVPVGVDWDAGDGGHELCDRGAAYDIRRAARAQSSDCTHVFQRSSAGEPGGVRRIIATQRWVAWWSSSTGEGGALGILSRSAATQLRVVELQALVD